MKKVFYHVTQERHDNSTNSFAVVGNVCYELQMENLEVYIWAKKLQSVGFRLVLAYIWQNQQENMSRKRKLIEERCNYLEI
jgi:hypothetical protein